MSILESLEKKIKSNLILNDSKLLFVYVFYFLFPKTDYVGMHNVNH